MMPASGPAPLVFGRYAVLSRLAVGGMGEIFLARQVGVSGFERPVILKSLLPDLLDQEGSVDMFLDEARVAGRLNHPNVVSVYEVGEWQGTYYIAMEYIEGENLGRLARAALRAGAPLPPRVCAEIIRDAALGLDHAHHATDAQGAPLELVHRDISPQNIMVRLDGLTKVVDFGVAKAANRATRTRTGILKGKLRYMSPEQVRSEPLDARSDQYALGVVLWELCTRRALIESDDPVAAMRRIALAAIPKPSSLVEGISPPLEAIILRMLARKREQRFARCADVARALQAYVDETPLPAAGEVSAVVTRLVGEAVRARLKDASEGADVQLPRAPSSGVSCPRCGHETGGTHRFCPQCGNALTPQALASQGSASAGQRPPPSAATPETLVARRLSPTPPPVAPEPSPPPPPLEASEGTVTLAATAPHEALAPGAADPRTVQATALEALPRARAPEAGALKRKLVIVTVLVEGGEALRQRLGAEEGLEAVGRMMDAAAATAERHEAEVVQLTEERWCFAFGLPAARRDDPLRAVRCALDMRRAVASLALVPTPTLRVGLEFDSALVSGGHGRSPWRVTGAGLDRAAVLAGAAVPGEVLAGGSVRALLTEEVRFGPERAVDGGPGWSVEGWGGMSPMVPFIGRAEPLAQAVAVIDSARALSGGARLFTAAAGLGKSRLLEAVAEHAARAAPLRWVRVSAGDSEAEGSMGLVRAVLTRLAATLGPTPDAAPLRPLTALGLSEPEIAALWRRLSAGGPAGQLQAGDAAVGEALLRAARPAGLLLLVDDVHRVDASSLEVLTSVLAAPGSRVALVGTAAPEALPAVLAPLPLTPLEELSRPELRALLAAACGAPLEAELEQRVAERAQGSPSFALELMRALIERGSVQRLGGLWRAAAPLTEGALPDSLALALGARLDQLPPPAQRLLARAAVEGGTFSASLVHASLQDESVGPEALGVLVTEGWVVQVPERPDTFRFALDLGRLLLLERLPPSVLRRAHGELAEALARDAFAAEPAREVRVADHLLAAGAPGAAAACERAGDLLAARGEWRAASEYLRRAVGEAPGSTPAARLWQLGVLARAAACLTQVDPAAVESLCAAWLERIPATEAPAAWAEVARRLAAAELKLGRVAQAEAHLLAAQGPSAADAECEAWVLGERARVREARGEIPGAVELLVHAFQRMGGKPARAPDFYWEHLNLLGRLQHRLGQPERARTAFTRACEQALAVGSAVGQARALSNLAGLRVLAGEQAAALADLERALALAEQAGDAQEVARIHYNAGRLLGAAGRLPEARERLERARERARVAGWREGEALATQALGALEARLPRR